jgi:LAO/AO transport system kinase
MKTYDNMDDMLEPKTRSFIMRMFEGDKSSLARLISLIEKESPEVPDIMEVVSSRSNAAYRIGITGLAGAGKSTLVDKLITSYRQSKMTVGVIAVDPSSLITGGAILGDRIRLQKHYLDGGVFIRSMATRGCYGGLCKAVDNTVKLMEASGKEVIFIETTGVGQTETEIASTADVVVMLLVPGFGDSIQLMKAGLIEIADIIVINKADREGAEVLANEVRDEMKYSTKSSGQTVILVEAANDIGVHEVYEELEKRRKNLKS